MQTISTRVDDATKERAEIIADSLGLSLSAVVNVFLKRFVLINGFPFDVRVPQEPVADWISAPTDVLASLVRQGIASADAVPRVPSVTYLDPTTNTLITHNPD